MGDDDTPPFFGNEVSVFMDIQVAYLRKIFLQFALDAKICKEKS